MNPGNTTWHDSRGYDLIDEWRSADQVRAVERVKDYLGRIRAQKDDVRAWAWLDADRALREAREADHAKSSLPLHGLVIGVKDIIDTHDMPTGLGFEPYERRRPQWDAACVAACRAAGAVMLGKTVTTEFAYFAPGKTKNPHDLTATPGGSSSGSAAAVADGMVDAAFGTQTAGSVIRPAAYCGVIGYKASYGLSSLSGVRPLAQSFDSLGIISRSLLAVSAIQRELTGDTDAVGSALKRTPSLALCRTEHWRHLQPAAQSELEKVVKLLQARGVQIDEINLPDSYSVLFSDHALIMAYEAARNYAFECEKHRKSLSAHFAALCKKGALVSYREYQAAVHRVSLARSSFARDIANFDALLTSSALGEAPQASEGTGDPVMSVLWTALGAPCVALPCGYGPRKRPLGIQLVSSPGADQSLLKLAASVEKHLPWTYRLPDRGLPR